ncbi:cysteine--tRNA ligase [Candidatus Parcubacteria bacterium]|nr:MAG: cysteine--tRNA ligase [Candidatus Parcubacteria bacterium]
MDLKLYNYLTRKKESFKPLKRGSVGLYTCGPTIYNFAHIGNFRTYIFEDILRRTLERAGWRVRHVMNLTDVDDKTIRDAAKADEPLEKFTDRYAHEFFRDIAALNIVPAWKYPRATGHIPAMVRLIQTLLNKEYAYVADDGVYFSIKKFKPYGKLSGVRARSLKAGARVSADEYDKDNVNDFALWKFKKPGEPSWPAPFGEGRPGWHVECSAMAMEYLGKTLDIHAGAVDLLFPHHEDEIAQSEAATGKPFVRYFVEAEHLMVDGKKMSKSLGNMFTLRDIEMREFHTLDFRLFVLGAHYRKPLNFTWAALEAARASRKHLLESVATLKTCSGQGTIKDETEAMKVIARLEKKFNAAIADDLNTPQALAVLHELIRYGLELEAIGRCTERAAMLLLAMIKNFDRVLGLQLVELARAPSIPAEIQKLAQEREEARQAKNWQEADRLRDAMKTAGFSVEDTPTGPRIRPL